jgi:hypothetical protein
MGIKPIAQKYFVFLNKVINHIYPGAKPVEAKIFLAKQGMHNPDREHDWRLINSSPSVSSLIFWRRSAHSIHSQSPNCFLTLAQALAGPCIASDSSLNELYAINFFILMTLI